MPETSDPPDDHRPPVVIAARQNTRSIRIWCAQRRPGKNHIRSPCASVRSNARLLAAHRTARNRHLQRGAGEGTAGNLQPVRSPARLTNRASDQAFHASRRAVADRAEIARHGQIPAVQSAFRLFQLGTFDLTFCRNVLIYFDQATKTDVLNRMARAIASDGYLVLGAAETVVGLATASRSSPTSAGLYVPNANRAEAVGCDGWQSRCAACGRQWQ